jgi:hypothetical protein
MLCKFFIQSITMTQMVFVPSDISLEVPTIPAPSHLFMISFSSSEDMRMQQIKGKITGLEGDLEKLYGYVDGLPGTQQRAARTALRRAFDMGHSMRDLDGIPASPPVTEEGELLLGPQLRSHITAMRRVYGDIADLKNTIEGIFGDASFDHLHTTLRRERKNNTGTTSTEFGITA